MSAACSSIGVESFRSKIHLRLASAPKIDRSKMRCASGGGVEASAPQKLESLFKQNLE